MRRSMRVRGLAVLFAVLAVAGCTEDPPTTPTNPTPTPTLDAFGSVLDVSGFAWRQIKVARIGTVKVRLVSLDHDVEAVVGLGIGTFNAGSGTCELIDSVETKPDLVNPQLSRTLTAGDYCVRIWDIGNLTRPNRFLIAIETP